MIKNSYWFWDAAIPDEVCDFIVGSCNWEDAKKADFLDTKTGELSSDLSLRDSEVIWSPQMSIVGCIAAQYIKVSNENAGWNFKYDFMEQIQLGRYGVGGHYDWHKDTVAPDPIDNYQRKLSFTLILNSSTDYVGGAFKFKELREDQQPKLGKGSIIVFPSFLEHKVEPVTEGERLSAVAWVNGTAFA
jgi:PKHD-type hydroxylase